MTQLQSGPFTLDYMESGNGEPVLLLHSTASGNRMWRRLTEDLHEAAPGRFRVLAPHLFGYGATTS